MLCTKKQQKQLGTLKLAILSLLACFPEPTMAAILRVVTEPINTSNLEVGYGGFNQADLFSSMPRKGGAKPAGGSKVLLAGKPSNQDPLSFQSLLNSLSQLRLNSSSNKKGAPPVPVLNQTDLANIYEGVYFITIKNRPQTDSSNQSRNTNNQPYTTPANIAPSLGPVVYLPQVAGPPPAVSLPGSVGLKSTSPLASGGLSGLGSLSDLKQQLSASPINGSGKLNDFFAKLDQFGGLRIKDNLRLQPKTAIATSLKLQPGYDLPSNLPRKGAGQSLAIANQIQQEADRNSQQLRQQQAELQRQTQRQIQEQQKENEKLRREQQRQLEQQQRQIMQQYQQQQQEVQKQLQQQLAEQQKLQQQLAQQQQALP